MEDEKYQVWEIKGRTLEFIPSEHLYICDGIIVRSVTQLLKMKFGGKYDGIDAGVLKAAADRGTAIHKAIEEYCKTGRNEDVPEVRDFKFLQHQYNFLVIGNEMPIILDFAGETYAGRLDLILNMNPADPCYAVADIKTTSTLDKDYLGHQLNLYRMGVEQCYDIVPQELYGIHLKDGKRKMVKIPIRSEKWLAESLNVHGV